MEIEDLPKKPKTGPLVDAPGAVGQKFFKKLIWYIKMVLLSKFGENLIKNKEILKNSQNWPLAVNQGEWSANFTKKS